MIRYLIKNNFKLMFRNKWVILSLILGPILVVGVLASAFNELLKSYEASDEFKVGYSLESGSLFEVYMPVMMDAGNEMGFAFIDYSGENPEIVMKEREIAVFIEFGTDTYTVYKSEEHKFEGITLEYFINKVINEGSNASLQMIGLEEEKTEVTIPVEIIEYMPSVNSTDYYGITFIVYFSWCGIICAAGVLNSEKKYGISRKYQVSTLSNIKMYMGIFIPVILTVFVGIGISTIVSSVLYEISWGNVMIAIFLIGLNVIGSSAYGLMLYKIFNNIAMTIISLFSTVWFMGFFGGSFETYMFSSIPQKVKLCSPIYHMNRALVENSCMGKSDYIISSVVYMLIIIVVCSLVGIVVDEMRKRGRA